jgi:hypothetical protein
MAQQWTVIMLVRSHTGPLLKTVHIREDCRVQEALALAAGRVIQEATPVIEAVALSGIHPHSTFQRDGRWKRVQGRRL